MAPHAPSKDIPDGRQIAWRIIRPTPKSVGLMAFLADGGVSAPLSRPKGDGPAKNHGRNPRSAERRVGKGVSVRVDPGERRLMNKKKQETASTVRHHTMRLVYN